MTILPHVHMIISPPIKSHHVYLILDMLGLLVKLVFDILIKYNMLKLYPYVKKNLKIKKTSQLSSHGRSRGPMVSMQIHPPCCGGSATSMRVGSQGLYNPPCRGHGAPMNPYESGQSWSLCDPSKSYKFCTSLQSSTSLM